MAAAAGAASVEHDVGHTRLIADLLKEVPCPARNALLKNAREFKYHCKLSEATVAPKQQLRIDLEATGYDHLVRRVLSGDYENYMSTASSNDKAYWCLKEGVQKIFSNRKQKTHQQSKPQTH